MLLCFMMLEIKYIKPAFMCVWLQRHVHDQHHQELLYYSPCNMKSPVKPNPIITPSQNALEWLIPLGTIVAN